ncbi:hypothetical protein ACFL5Z_21150, partial [Planctomycetota bacterium]
GLAPVGAVEAMMAERVVSLSWRLKRAERMSNEVIDVKIAQVTTGSWDKSRRREAGLAEDTEEGVPELILGWATIRDYGDAQVLERLLLYEKRIESSLYKAMNELQKLQRTRKLEETKDERLNFKKQSQLPISPPGMLRSERIKIASQSHCSAASANSAVNAKQSQCRPPASQ